MNLALKIDKKNPKHWLYLAVFTFNVCLGVLLRSLLRVRSGDVVLYGHKLNGNLKALYDHVREERPADFGVSYLTMDPAYYRVLRENGERVLNGLNPIHMVAACRAASLVTDHGLHSLIILAKLTGVKLVDVWHGIPFKGFDADDFSSMRSYTAIMVSSPSMKDKYVSRFGFSDQQVRVTGYGRTDRLLKGQYDRAALLDQYPELPQNRHIVMFAPTWTHGHGAHRELPFGEDIESFLSAIGPLLERSNSCLVVRTHLNTSSTWSAKSDRTIFMPMGKYPQTEELLFLADALICDWSSIAFDFLVLRRPTIFIDCEAPFGKGFTYGPEHRFGPVVGDRERLESLLLLYLQDPQRYEADYGQKMDEVTREVYGEYLDGCATRRYVNELVGLASQGANSKSLLSG